MNNQNPETSVIIRTKNEEKYLGQVLEMLKNQTYQNFEIILVDDHSIDKTLEIAEKYKCKIITIPKGKFSHPFSCNLGAKNSKGKYLVFLNGHCLPTSLNFLKNGIKNFNDKKVAGAYSLTIAHKQTSLADKLIYNIGGYTYGMLRFSAGKRSPGILGTTNAIIRKDLWGKHPFNEKYNKGWGGEDSEWARYYLSKGYKIIHDPKFKVRHSHNLAFKDIVWQFKNWKRMISQKGKTPEKQKRNF